MKLKNFIITFIAGSIILELAGCDAFVRKFTKKPTKENMSEEEMVLAPEEYKGPNMSKEELYRQYFLFWKSWSDELMEALIQGKSQKKQLDCAQEAIKNLESLKAILNLDTQKKLDIYIGRLNDLKNAISQDLYGNNSLNNAHDAERLRIDISQKFSYDKIKNNLQ
jgi:hypothetical protein